jgi:hypothetical protein
MAESPVEIVQRWEDHGADWRVVHVSDGHVLIDLCTCTGEPVERLESSDPELIRFVRERAG